jgi:hypothetical protein
VHAYQCLALRPTNCSANDAMALAENKTAYSWCGSHLSQLPQALLGLAQCLPADDRTRRIHSRQCAERCAAGAPGGRVAQCYALALPMGQQPIAHPLPLLLQCQDVAFGAGGTQLQPLGGRTPAGVRHDGWLQRRLRGVRAGLNSVQQCGCVGLAAQAGLAGVPVASA